MSIVYRIDKTIGATFVVWDGAVTDEEFLSHTSRMASDPGWPPPQKMHLVDLTSLTSTDGVSVQALEEGAAAWGKLGVRVAGLRAAVVANDAFDKSRVFEALVARYGVNVIVFNSLHTASIWLGIDAEKAESALNALRDEARANR
jgi:hypothetical protein